MSGENPFGGFDNDWANTPEAQKGGGLGRVPPGVYKCMLTAVDPGTGTPAVDKEVIDNRKKGGSLGLKLFLEILSPEKAKNPNTGEEEVVKGKIIEHVFWVTGNTLDFVKRDAHTILGRELKTAGELYTVQWAGHTVEVGVRDEEYNGYINSRVYFWNKWDPKAATPAAAPKAGATAAPRGPVATKKAAAKTGAPAGGSGGTDVEF